MKKVYVSALSFLFVCQLFAQTTDRIDQQWLTRAQERIASVPYQLKNGNAGSQVASNAAQRLVFSITPGGYSVSPMRASNSGLNEWNQSLQFGAIAKGIDIYVPQHDAVATRQNAGVSFNYGNYSIEYNNDVSGLRQNFIVNEKIDAPGELKVLMTLNGSLIPKVSDAGIKFLNSDGKVALIYSDLRVWDAKSHILAAKMELSGNELSLIIDDHEATYPITIDPLNKTPEWSSSADGLLPTLIGQTAINAAYGFTVAGLGDVNHDGFDDVAIGAPAMPDIISGNGNLAAVGAVFVFYGSANGLPSTPNVVLQPNTAVAGALFGYSITGGDLTNDAKNEILIGAPMDNISLSVGGGGTATGKIGKVYIYNGEGLSNGSTPFLQLQLSGTGILENGVNLSINALFGFSVAVTDDLNGDGRRDVIVGAPTYAGIKTGLLGNSIADVQSGGAFVFLSAPGNTYTFTLTKLNPIQTSVLGSGILQSNINGLLFGYCVDGVGDYNGDNKPDVIATAPAGVDLSSLGVILNGKLLQGSASVYYGTGSGINTNTGALLVASSGGLLSNITGTLGNVANLFGESVKGIKNESGSRNGNILVGAPLGGTIVNVLNLQLKTGTVNVFKKKANSPAGNVTPDQILSSPRNSNNVLSLIQSNLLFGYSLDNVFDINCDGYDDIIVGEPASSGAQLINANIAGGAAYVYLGKADGTYQTAPYWTFTATSDAFLGVNATSLIGYSVAGAGHTKGVSASNKVLIGTPSRTLDFGSGLLNLGNTLSTVFSLTAGNNGVGKGYLFDLNAPCSNTPSLPDLTPSIYNDGTTVKQNETRDNVMRIFNIGPGSTTGTIIFTVPKMLPAFEININPTATNMDVFGGTPVHNSSFTITEDANRYVFTSKAGVAIPAGGYIDVGVVVKTVGIVNSTGNLSIQIVFGCGGGETPYNNNSDNHTYSIN